MSERNPRARAESIAAAALAATLKPGALVWYHPRPGVRYPAVVDAEPREMGESWVVRLRELPEEYSRDCRKDPPDRRRTTVPAAALFALELRHPTPRGGL